mmetsp:Transcript_23999/g.79767  ORF Transcript_23999/g.79767 Transcript_23999/m.79767 type:complete len:680 (+) Transcript_23999:134-2173(+)
MVATPRRAAVSEGPTLHKQITMMSQRGGSHPAPVQQRGKLGTYKGVLVPTCENMWGVIIFLRFYKIVGYSGLGYALLIASLSFMVALLTALSLSAIATCGTSQGLAGVYPMLARALGKEMATAVGLVYFLGIVFLAVLEVLGACEELEMVQHSLFEFTTHINAVRAWASAFMLALALLVAGGIRLISQLGLVFFAVVLLTMLSFYLSLFGAPNLEPIDAPANATGPAPTGLSTANLRANWGPSFAPGYEFTDCLAIFFPCFTGILSGANRASSLRDPASAIPRGTLGAITLSFCVYVSFLILWAAVGERDYLTMEHGQLDELIYPSVKAAQIGIVLSSLGQALQCVVVAPRLLVSIAADGMLRPMRSLARLTGGEPKLALAATYLVGAMCVLIGSLNAVAPLLSMCFLTCYSMMNLNCCLLGLLKDPHWRPRFRYFHWAVGLVGFVLCTSIMFVIDWRYALGAWLLTLLVLALVVRTNAQTDWGSALVGLRFQLAMRSLTGIDIKAHLDENWRTPPSSPLGCPPSYARHPHSAATRRPQLLLLYQLREEESHGSRRGSSAAAGWGEAEPPAEPSSSSLGDLVRADVGHTHERMFSVAAQLRHGSGLVIAAAVVPGASADSLRAVALAEAERARMDSLMGRMGVRGFCKTILARTLLEGKLGAIQWAGRREPSRNLLGTF